MEVAEAAEPFNHSLLLLRGCRNMFAAEKGMVGGQGEGLAVYQQAINSYNEMVN